MKKMKRVISGLAGMTVLLTSGFTTQAVHVNLKGGMCQLPLADSAEEDAGVDFHAVTEFGILGMKDEQTLVIGTSDAAGYIDLETFESYFPGIKLPELPTVEETSTYYKGSSGEAVKVYQQALIDLKYLEGDADGDFGGKSAEATMAFQKANGLEEDGEADPVTYWLALDQAGEGDKIAVEYAGEDYTPEEKFSAIYGKTSADLEPFMDPGWRFTYDPFEEKGYIDPKVTLAEVEEGSSDLDKVKIIVSLEMMCAVDYMTDEYLVKPVLKVEYAGAYRPYIKGAQISVGSEAAYLTEAESDSHLEGIQVIETAYITLDDTALSFLKNADVKKAAMRLECQDKSTDLTLDLSDLWCRDQIPDHYSVYDDDYDYMEDSDY